MELFPLWLQDQHQHVLVECDQEDASNGPVFAALLETNRPGAL